MTVDDLRTALLQAGSPQLRSWAQRQVFGDVSTVIRKAWASVGYRADIPWVKAEDAYRGTSHSPERRAESAISAYATHIEKLESQLTQEQLEEYRQGYRQRYLAWLHAAAQVMSVMITGRGNFPVAQQEKKRASEDNRQNELQEWSHNFLKRAERTERKAEVAAAGGPIEELERNLKERRNNQEVFRTFNAILRKKDTLENKIGAALALGLSSKDVALLIKEGGFPAYKLTNNLAEIKRLEERLEVERRKSAQRSVSLDFEAHGDFPGGVVTYNTEEDRLQVTFTARLSQDAYTQMKSCGFRTTREGLFQRQLTDAAVMATRRLLKVRLPRLGGLKVPVPLIVEHELTATQSDFMASSGLSIENGALIAEDTPEHRQALGALVRNVLADYASETGLETAQATRKAMLSWAKAIR